ncbi:MAG: hypothetical protein K2O42_03410, partial [Oscillospiraceae bacterium]|nr:hypothetical protein [Oscillospiraceae bacterium]
MHTATIAFAQDAKYYLNVSYTDEAGNAGKNFSTDFYVDNHDPELTISVNGDTTFNAYGKEKTIGTMIHYEDTNFDDQQVSISLSGIRVEVSEPEIKEDTIMFILTRTDEATGKVETRTWSGTIEDIFKNGQLYGKTITFEDFPSDFNNPDDKMFDDIYTFYVQVTDKAGRISNAGNPDKNQFAFSVNRFGSTYNVSEEIKSVLKKVYVQEIGNVIVSEINPNELTKKSVVLFKNSQQITLKENVDYQVIAAGEEKEWHEYTYQINQNVFEDDGRYRIELQSIDKAGNNSTNVDMQDRSDDENESGIEFFMDKTPPTAVIPDLKNGKSETVNGSRLTVTMSASDNMKLSEVIVYVDENDADEQIYQWDETMLISDSEDNESTAESESDPLDGKFTSAEIDSDFLDGIFTFKVSATPLGQRHQLKVICKDASGRENEPLIIEITAIDTSNPWLYLIMIGG